MTYTEKTHGKRVYPVDVAEAAIAKATNYPDEA